MLARFVSVVVLSAIASLAITGAVANPVTNGGCNLANISCCNVVQSPADLKQGLGKLDGLSDLGGLLGLGSNLDDLLDLATGVTGNIGFGCSLLAATECNQQAVCCSDTQFNGLVNVGCNPINVNL